MYFEQYVLIFQNLDKKQENYNVIGLRLQQRKSISENNYIRDCQLNFFVLKAHFLSKLAFIFFNSNLLEIDSQMEDQTFV